MQNFLDFSFVLKLRVNLSGSFLKSNYNLAISPVRFLKINKTGEFLIYARDRFPLIKNTENYSSITFFLYYKYQKNPLQWILLSMLRSRLLKPMHWNIWYIHLWVGWEQRSFQRPWPWGNRTSQRRWFPGWRDPLSEEEK